MSFYQTSNANIIRFRTAPRKVVAPFAAMQRVVQIQNIGAGTTAYNTGTNSNFFLNPEQLQNGALIISPANQSAGGSYTLPFAYSLQEFLGGRGAFNMDSQNTGANSFFILNVYNLSTNTGNVVAWDNLSSKQIVAAPVANDASLTPVLIQFNGVNNSYATVNGVPNYVSYTLF